MLDKAKRIVRKYVEFIITKVRILWEQRYFTYQGVDVKYILKECQEVINLGIKSIILFGIPNLKDSIGSDALDENGIIARSLRAIKEKFPNLFVITDLCFCEYTDHGHCGILDHVCKSVDNDATLEISAKQALIHAKAGADMIAPSGMMDGIIYTLRKALDENGYENLFFMEEWIPFSDLAHKLPLTEQQLMDRLLKKSTIEFKEGKFTYFVCADSILQRNDTKPIEMVSDEIKELLLNSKKANFIKMVKRTLYEDALKTGGVILY
jgi:hypothetical protein